MTDITRYRNVSLTHDTYNTLVKLSKVLLPDAKLSISKTVEALAHEKARKLNRQSSRKGSKRLNLISHELQKKIFGYLS